VLLPVKQPVTLNEGNMGIVKNLDHWHRSSVEDNRHKDSMGARTQGRTRGGNNARLIDAAKLCKHRQPKPYWHTYRYEFFSKSTKKATIKSIVRHALAVLVCSIFCPATTYIATARTAPAPLYISRAPDNCADNESASSNNQSARCRPYFEIQASADQPSHHERIKSVRSSAKAFNAVQVAGSNPFDDTVQESSISSSQQNSRPSLKFLLLRGLIAITILSTITFFIYRGMVTSRAFRELARSEKAIYDAVAGLALETQNLERDIAAVLRQVEALYGLKAASVVLLQPKEYEVQAIYCSEPDGSSPIELIDDSITAIRNHNRETSDVVLWRQQGPGLTSNTTADEASYTQILNSLVWLNDRIGALLVAECQANRVTRQTDNQALQFITQLLAIVMNDRTRVTESAAPKTRSNFANENLEELAGNIAHEFNNLLTPIMGYAEMAAEGLSPGSSSRTYIERIRSAGERARETIDQVLSFSKNENKQGSFDAINAIIEILPDLKMCLPKSINFDTRLPDRSILIAGSATALQQAIFNLFKNAGEALCVGGNISLDVKTIDQATPRTLSRGQLVIGPYLRIRLADTGPGIPKDHMQRIFEPHFTTKSRTGGTGLGLAMVLRVVQHLNGALNVRSNPGNGTHFDLFIPCFESKNVASPARSALIPKYVDDWHNNANVEIHNNSHILLSKLQQNPLFSDAVYAAIDDVSPRLVLNAPSGSS
jgi:signal transduction histidine kinase